eukprot:scaffold3048_cov192-Amphora_coffeaeformis.AAC.2
MESFSLHVDDHGQSNGGMQCIITTEGYVAPIHICEGLPYIDMSAPSDANLEHYPHVFFTSDSPWDPSVMDQEFSMHDFEIPVLAITRREATDNRVDEFGEVRQMHHAFCDGRLPSLSEDLPNLVPDNEGSLITRTRDRIIRSSDHWIIGSLDDWMIGSLDHWIIGSLDHWIIG